DPEITNHVLWPTELKRRVSELSVSRRYNQVPLLCSHPGGFRGSWPYRTRPFCACKGSNIFGKQQMIGNIFFRLQIISYLCGVILIRNLSNCDYDGYISCYTFI
ncbi:MAG: hypothetical protein J1E37_05225, partial [Prevotella sp.]|nr:hypothetical protein [Prevotella sp.]